MRPTPSHPLRALVPVLAAFSLAPLVSTGCSGDESPPSGSNAAASSHASGSGAGSSGDGGGASGTGGSGAGGSGGHEPARFPLTISANKRHLVDADGTPFLMRGDTAWSLVAELSKADATLYLDDRAARGFNTLLVNLIEPAFSSHDPKWANADGQTPFADPDDFTTLNDAYFEHVDWVLEQAEQRGILVLLVPSYIGYGCGAEGWCARMKTNGVAKLTQYGTYVGERYRDARNVIWVHGGDHTPQTAGSPSEMDLVNAVRSGIVTGSEGAQLHTAHWSSETSAGDVAGTAWLDVDTTYTYTSPHVYVKALADRERNAGVRPFFLIESSYENEHATTQLELRSQIYHPVLAGGAGFVFGNYPMWGFWDPGDPGWFLDDGGFPGGWKTALDGAGSKAAALTGDILSALPWHELEPDTDHAIATAGYGDFGSDAYALLAHTPGGEVAVAYLTANLDLTIDLSQMAGSATVRWLDPSSGEAVEVEGSPFANAGMETFTPPAENAGGEQDWLLLIETE
jgi:hypothetical protein